VAADQAGWSCQPLVVERSPRVAERARLAAAANNLKSWVTRTSPRTGRGGRRGGGAADAPAWVPPWVGWLGSRPARRVALAGAGGGQLGLWGVDGDHPTPEAGRASLPERADPTGDAEPSPPTATPGRADRHGDPGRAGHGAGHKVEAELVFGEPAAGCGGQLGLDHRGEPVVVQPGQVRASAIGAVAIDHRLGGLGASPSTRSPSSPGATAASPAVATETSAAQMTSLSGSTATWALPVGTRPVNWEILRLAWLLLSSSRGSPQPESTAAHGAAPEGSERSAGRCRRRRAGAAWRGRSEGHLTWPPPPRSGMPTMTRLPRANAQPYLGAGKQWLPAT
jgi:hypothetical protein